MNVSLAQAAAALNANSRWQEAIADNLAASAVPGFKKQELALQSVSATAPGVFGPGQAAFVLPVGATATNFQDGEKKFTGSKTDVALSGPGFLAVQLPNGDTAYTRDGELRIDQAGQMVTKQGYAVLGQNGPIQLDLNNRAALSISATGEVSQGTESRGRLQAVEFSHPQLLAAIGPGYFLARHPDLLPQESTATTFHQGFLEAANTSAPAEMAQLIGAMRIYEANQRVLQTHNERMSTMIRDASNPS